MKMKGVGRLQIGRLSRPAMLYRIGRLAHLLSLKIESDVPQSDDLDGDIKVLLEALKSFSEKGVRKR